jgi:hypothetical protein
MISFFTLYRRPILVISAVLIPCFGLYYMANKGELFPKSAPADSAPMQNEQVQQDYPFLTLEYMIETTKAQWQQAEKMGENEYARYRVEDPNLPLSVEDYRKQLQEKLTKLQAMSPQAWQEELKTKIPPLVWSQGTQKGETAERKDDPGFTPTQKSLDTLLMEPPKK